MRSSLSGLGSALVALTIAAGCSTAKAQVAMPESTPLSIPQAPARVVMPPSPEPAPVVTDTPPASSSTTSANPPAGSARPNRETRQPATPPSNPPAATPPPVPTAPTTPLETQGNQSELELRARNLLGTADETLKKINYQALSADGKAQYDTAQRFISQANSALVAKNVVYAWQLADKANTIATLLLRHA